MKPDEAMQTAKSIIKFGLGASAGEEPALENAIAEALLWAAKPKGEVMTQDQLDALVDFIRAEAEKAAEDGDPDGSFRMVVRERLKSLYEAFGLRAP